MVSTVGDARRAIAYLIDVSHDHVLHYAMVIETPRGTVLNFCCDDQADAAQMLRGGAELLLNGAPSGRLPDIARAPEAGDPQ